ncbi:hypothetical protein J437_LFUL019165 [Ladona fulva]|uniref:Uncharacterized protein n=1 Tax=Ladona fulva TaxID=123851 RepID=A0A8K0KS64_LADFU|nr:hypothetical protein J437_LFUL019165 [Ladona fulva]
MSVSSHTIKPLVTDNYDTWAMQIEAGMVINGSWKYVDGLSADLQVWERLKSEFASSGPVKEAGLLKHISKYKICKGDDIRSQLMDFFDISVQLESLDIAVNLELLTIILLNSLLANFDVFRGAIQARDKFLRPEWLRDKILEEVESRNQKLTVAETMWIKKCKGVFKEKKRD